MADQVLKIDGVDIVPYTAYEGLKWSYSAIDGPSAGRSTNGEVIRDLVADKIRWDVTCRPLTGEEQTIILKLIKPEFFTVEYLDPITNQVTRGTFYANNYSTSYKIKRKNGTNVWAGLTFPLIQK